MQYSGTLGGHEVQLNGTIQVRRFCNATNDEVLPADLNKEIMTQMTVLYPDFDPASVAATADLKTLPSRAALSPRNKNGLICNPVPGWNWALAYGPDIIDGIRYLLGAGGFLINSRSCLIVSCTGDAQIVVCNDVSLSAR